MRATSEEIAIFVAVVESGSFSRAAEQLGQANSAVSRAVKKLESKLGVSLLNRTTRQLSLTEEGERYFRRMQVVLQEMAAAENELLESRTTPRGLLRVDAATPVILHFLMPLIKPFRERYPEMSLTLVSSETFINLIERKVDVAIRAGTLTDSSLRARPLFNSYRKIIASPDYLARHGTPQSVAELKNHQCLGFSEPVSLNTGQSPAAMASCWKSKARYLPIAEKRSSSCAWPVTESPVCRTIWWIRKLLKGRLSNCWLINGCRLKCRLARFTTATEP